jgi:hypothetical protein
LPGGSVAARVWRVGLRLYLYRAGVSSTPMTNSCTEPPPRGNIVGGWTGPSEVIGHQYSLRGRSQR